MIRGPARRARLRMRWWRRLSHGAGGPAAGSHAMGYAVAGGESRAEPKRRGTHLAQLWFAAASRLKTFKLSTIPWLVEKVRDIVGLYLNPARTCRHPVVRG